MFFAIAPFPRRGRQAGVFAEDFAKLAHVIKPTFHRHFGKRQQITDQQFFCRSHPLAMQRFD
ncbi:hypothetical protein [Citrobacter pasteurii]|nr:hypothetical protein SF123566_8006 [Shigella flexneri 1235-66]CEJ64775.1 hypothetical protein [Citrobacter pasteurii]